MLKLLKRFWNEEEGFGTVELVIIIGVLVVVALIFRNYIIDFVQRLLREQVPDVDQVTVPPAPQIS